MIATPSFTSSDQMAGAEPAFEVPAGSARNGYWRSHPRLADALVAAAYAVAAVAANLLFLEGASGDSAEALGVTGIVTALVAGVALQFRRRTPLIALVVTTSMMLITFSHSADFASVAVACALYSTAVYRSARSAWIGFGCASAALLLTSLTVSQSMTAFWDSSQIVIVLAVGVLIGLAAGDRRRYVSSLIGRAEQLVRERDQQAQLAAAAERASIAREMHDIVSHSLTVMVSLAYGSAELGKTDPNRATAAMRQVAQTGSTALADLRRILGVLHSTSETPDHVATAPQPGVAALPALFDRFRDAGLPLTATVAGAPPADPGQQLAIYRLVQEALTNSLKHASGAQRVTAAIEFSRGAVAISVDDDGRAVGLRDRHTGRGLIGMSERAALYGGSLDTGPNPHGGWSVHAQFPLAPGATS